MSVGEIDAPSLCDRWFGVGADGVIRVGRGSAAPFSFRLTNADGSDAEMSGNGMRCLGAWLRDRGHVAHGASFDVETPAGLRHLWLTLDGATVGMGQPNFTLAAIPMRGPAWETFQRQPFDLGDGRTMHATALSMGNPHLVLFTEEDPERYHLEHLGPALEHHERFPERTNVEFARDRVRRRDRRPRVGTRRRRDARVRHRRVRRRGRRQRGRVRPRAEVVVRFRGGPLHVERRTDGEVLLGGPVAHVFDAEVDLDELDA